jgi:hypothetical protein
MQTILEKRVLVDYGLWRTIAMSWRRGGPCRGGNSLAIRAIFDGKAVRRLGTLAIQEVEDFFQVLLGPFRTNNLGHQEAPLFLLRTLRTFASVGQVSVFVALDLGWGQCIGIPASVERRLPGGTRFPGHGRFAKLSDDAIAPQLGPA